MFGNTNKGKNFCPCFFLLETEYYSVLGKLGTDGETEYYSVLGKLGTDGARLYGLHDILPKKLNFHYDIYLQPSVEWGDNYRGSAEVGVDIPMWKELNFTANYIYSYENIVVIGVKQEDTIITFGLSYNLRKI